MPTLIVRNWKGHIYIDWCNARRVRGTDSLCLIPDKTQVEPIRHAIAGVRIAGVRSTAKAVPGAGDRSHTRYQQSHGDDKGHGRQIDHFPTKVEQQLTG